MFHPLGHYSQADWERFLGLPPGAANGVYGKKVPEALDGFNLADPEPPAPRNVRKPIIVASRGGVRLAKGQSDVAAPLDRGADSARPDPAAPQDR